MLIGPEKVLIDPKKALIDLENISIHNSIDKLNANQATKEKANLLFEKMGFDKIFGRKEIMENINVSITAAGNLLNHLKNAGLIKTVKGFGKGKYQFVRQEWSSRKNIDKLTITRYSIDSKSDQLNIVYHSC